MHLRLGRAAIVAILVGFGLMLLVPLSVYAASPVVGFVREVDGLGRAYFATRSFFNFVGGGLLNIVAFQSFAIALIMLALRGRNYYPRA